MANQRLCSIPDCGKPHIARGWCKMHWARWRAHGDPLKLLITPFGEPERYLREVILTYEGDECLPWPFGRMPNGYGSIWQDGKTKTVSRLVCAHANGPPPTPKHEAAHSCGKGHLACVTKRHLSWKTHKENDDDKVAHGTMPSRQNGRWVSAAALAASQSEGWK